jgi:hypothetical protein
MTGISAIILCVVAILLLLLRLLKEAKAMHPPAPADLSAQVASRPAGGQTIPCQDDDHAMASWIWKNLVPREGGSSTVQGELLRAVENGEPIEQSAPAEGIRADGIAAKMPCSLVSTRMCTIVSRRQCLSSAV